MLLRPLTETLACASWGQFRAATSHQVKSTHLAEMMLRGIGPGNNTCPYEREHLLWLCLTLEGGKPFCLSRLTPLSWGFSPKLIASVRHGPGFSIKRSARFSLSAVKRKNETKVEFQGAFIEFNQQNQDFTIHLFCTLNSWSSSQVSAATHIQPEKYILNKIWAPLESLPITDLTESQFSPPSPKCFQGLVHVVCWLTVRIPTSWLGTSGLWYSTWIANNFFSWNKSSSFFQ